MKAEPKEMKEMLLPQAREEKKRREKEATCAQFFNLTTKKAIEIEESLAKAKALEAEATIMAEERESMLVDTTNMAEDQNV